jgi:hypothetical protein
VTRTVDGASPRCAVDRYSVAGTERLNQIIRDGPVESALAL